MLDQEAVAVMHGGAAVGHAARLVRRATEHAAGRCEAQRRELYAREQAGAHLHHCLGTRVHDEAVGAGDARPVQQGVNGDNAVQRPLDPEGAKGRKFFHPARMERDGARRDAVGMAASERAEIAGAQKRDDLVLPSRRVQLTQQLEAAEAQLRGRLHQSVEVEVRGAPFPGAGHAVHHLMQRDAVRKQVAAPEGLQRETVRVTGPAGRRAPEGDAAPPVVVQVGQGGRQVVGRWHEGARCEVARHVLDSCGRERGRLGARGGAQGGKAAQEHGSAMQRGLRRELSFLQRRLSGKVAAPP
jgi:hypothetical protein